MIRINLLPAEEAKRAAGRRADLAIGGLVVAAAVLGFVALHAWQGVRLASGRRQLNRLTQQLAALQGPYAEVTRMDQQKQELREKLRVIAQLEAKKVGPVRILADLSKATPDKLWLTEFQDSSGTLKLTGLGADEQTVADFLRRLSTLPFFRSVDLDETSQVNQEGTKLKKFVIRGALNYAPGTEPEQATAGTRGPEGGTKKKPSPKAGAKK
jgi:type IV pilus assembly protein PilN